METPESGQGRPVEVIAAVVLILVGIAATCFATSLRQGYEWLGVAGGAIATFGGIALSYTVCNINTRAKALRRLKPELESITRNLGDNATRLRRAIELQKEQKIDSVIALDRVGQLVTPLVVVVDELDRLVGARTSFESIVETMERLMNVDKKIEELGHKPSIQSETASDDLQKLREERDSLYLQIRSAQRELGLTQVAKADEEVQCPSCNSKAVVKLGRASGDSTMLTCASCGHKYHIHRDAQGKVFTRLWGASTATEHLDVRCPECGLNIPLNMHADREYEDRYCLNCAKVLLRIAKDGSVQKLRDATALPATIAGYQDERAILHCPKSGCETDTISVWFGDGVSRGVCRGCGEMLEAEIPSARSGAN